MPTYQYRCSSDHEFTEWGSIHADTLTATCDCGNVAVKVLQVPRVSVYATPHKGQSVRDADATEARWTRDMPEYKAMRRQGLQPPQIDGSADLANRAHSQLEVEMGDLIPRDRVSEANEVNESLRENARLPGTPEALGKFRRGENQ